MQFGYISKDFTWYLHARPLHDVQIDVNQFNLLQSCHHAHRLHFNVCWGFFLGGGFKGGGNLFAIPEWKLLLTCWPRQFERKQARDVCVSGERWMTAVQRKWFRSLFQSRNQPFLQAMTADINCGTCDFLLPAQIMIVWTTGALAPCPQCHRKMWSVNEMHTFLIFQSKKVDKWHRRDIELASSFLTKKCI